MKSSRILGIGIDSSLNLKAIITKKCQTAMLNIFRIKHIRRYLTQDAHKVLVHSLVMSHRDYCNSLYYGLPDCDLNRLQRVQSVTCELVLNRSNMTVVLNVFLNYTGYLLGNQCYLLG